MFILKGKATITMCQIMSFQAFFGEGTVKNPGIATEIAWQGKLRIRENLFY
jgi:hypothetical protein